jgi:hypothetical protein
LLPVSLVFLPSKKIFLPPPNNLFPEHTSRLPIFPCQRKTAVLVWVTGVVASGRKCLFLSWWPSSSRGCDARTLLAFGFSSGRTRRFLLFLLVNKFPGPHLARLWK